MPWSAFSWSTGILLSSRNPRQRFPKYFFFTKSTLLSLLGWLQVVHISRKLLWNPARIANPRQHCENKLENAGEHKGNICEFVAKLQVESSRHGLQIRAS